MTKIEDRRADILQMKNKYSGMLLSDMKWFKHLEEYNAKLKNLMANLNLDKLKLLDALT